MKEKIEFSDWDKLDLVVGQINKVENHPDADKLYILEVDLGEDSPRTIIAGIKPFYTKEELENKKAIFIANLKPIKLRGIESNGMILAAGNKDKTKVVFLIPEKDLEVGSRIS
jgi:methionyl-tRNA synthetase|tara:strand:- start:603 stop:941 length:339 start_codon:yes stop_codon:yes gene_type:complete